MTIPRCDPYQGTGQGVSLTAEKAGRLQDLPPTTHRNSCPLQPTLRTGTETLVTAALAWPAILCRTDLAPADLSLHAAARDERLTGYQGNRFAGSICYVRSYPDELPVLAGQLDVIDAGHFTWEDTAAGIRCPHHELVAGGYKTATRTPTGY
jgi:hypothetical protein